jgi:hypothetical protein
MSEDTKGGTVKSEETVLKQEPARMSKSAAVAVAGWLRTAADPALSEDLAWALLKRADLPAEALENLSKNVKALKSRKVKMALASHPHTPRHVSVPLARRFYTFELMRVALSPSVPADVKVAIDDILISRLKMITVGERLTLARRASGRVAAALLLDVDDGDGKTLTGHDGKIADGTRSNAKPLARENRVMQTALENPRLTETLVISSVLRPLAKAALVSAVARHPKWSKRREIRAALLRTEHLSLANALEFGREIPAPLLSEILTNSRLPTRIKNQLLRESGRQDSAY